MSRYPNVTEFSPFTKMCFFISGFGNWYLHFYHGNATFNIKLILLSDIHRIICAFKNLHMAVLIKLILSAAMIILWTF